MKMKRLVDEIVALGNELRVLHGQDDALARPRPPASAAALEAIGKRVGRRAPPSYFQLLSLYDGIDNFDWVNVDLLSSSFLLSHEDQDLAWVKYGNFAAGERFIFAQSSDDPHCIAFLARRVTDGEMEVIDFDNKESTTYPNLEAYLSARRDWFAKWVAKDKAKAKPKPKPKRSQR